MNGEVERIIERMIVMAGVLLIVSSGMWFGYNVGIRQFSEPLSRVSFVGFVGIACGVWSILILFRNAFVKRGDV